MMNGTRPRWRLALALLASCGGSGTVTEGNTLRRSDGGSRADATHDARHDVAHDGCVNECTPGTTECLAGGVASCATGANGCATWGVPVACGTGETPCDAGFVNDQGKFVLACTQQPDAAASCACLCQAGPACEH